MWFIHGRKQRAGPSRSIATITTLESNVARMAPAVVSFHGLDSQIVDDEYHLSRFQWSVDGPVGWTPPTCLDPRPGLQEDDVISLSEDCEGFTFCLYASIAGTYTVHLTITEKSGAQHSTSVQVVVAEDTRTHLYVSGTGNDTTGNGTVGNPWRQPSKAWEHIIANGKQAFAINIERGYQYGGTDADGAGNAGCSNILIQAYGSGSQPILKWSLADYPDDNSSLIGFSNCSGCLVRDLNLRSNDSDNLYGFAVRLSDENLNLGFVDLTFGGTDPADSLAYCFVSEANNPREQVPEFQSRGYGFFNCQGHSSAYFIFFDAPDTEGVITDVSLSPTTTSFECASGGNLSSIDDAYNGMEILIQTSASCRNEKRVVLDYVANAGGGRSRFTLSSALSSAPNDGDVVYIVDIDSVGDSDIFLFGCRSVASSGLGTEVRLRCINGSRLTAVGCEMDGSTNAIQPKSGFRLMVDYCYLYRCAERNGGVQMGAEIATGGIGPHLYMVFDRSYADCLQATSKSPMGFDFCKNVHVKGSVLRGDLTTTNNGYILAFTSAANAICENVRIAHCTMYTKRNNHESILISSYQSTPFLTFENNLLARGLEHYADLIQDETSVGAYVSVKNNVYCPNQQNSNPSNLVFRVANVQMNLATWLAEAEIDGDTWGTITPEEIDSLSFVPDETDHPSETTNRTFTSEGVFQDYYGNSPVGHTYVGAVSRAIP